MNIEAHTHWDNNNSAKFIAFGLATAKTFCNL